jgi:hypothetical protein
MPHEFVILVNGKLEIFTRYEDIPEEFENVIKFLPEVPDAPHTEEQHEEIEKDLQGLRLPTPHEGSFCWRGLSTR